MSLVELAGLVFSSRKARPPKTAAVFRKSILNTPSEIHFLKTKAAAMIIFKDAANFSYLYFDTQKRLSANGFFYMPFITASELS